MSHSRWREEAGLPPLPRVLTVDETARALRISRTSAYEAVRTGEIPSVRIGRRILVPSEVLECMLRTGLDGERAANLVQSGFRK